MKVSNTKRLSGIAAIAAGLIVAGCLNDGGASSTPAGSPSGKAVVGLRVDVGSVNSVLAKGAVISLNKVVIVFTSSANDTVRDTLTTSTTPALSATSTAQQTLEKFYNLKISRSWKAYVTVRDAKDSVTHRDSSISTGVLLAADTAHITLNLTPKFVMYRARFLTIPDSVGSASPGTSKQKLRLNRLLFKIDGVTVRDSLSSPGYFTAGATHVLDYDYVAPGPHTILMQAFGPMGSWDSTQALYSGSKSVDVSATGSDTTVTLTLNWVGPTTGGGTLSVTVGRIRTLTADGTLPGNVVP
jgi:hypothetical protein